ncbi:MAG: ParB/RepB/Spo0J family partition protein [Chitinophagales bacterium]|nr:ParB/RepB/Spo0J family partition protein [Chitinophagales bacterium]
MSAKKEDLGKGIRALLGGIEGDLKANKSVSDTTLEKVSNVTIPLNQIEVNPFQPRADFDMAALQELADSIKVHGVIQPLTVRSLGPNKYQLIAGERRLRASKMAGLEVVPVYIRKADDQEMLEIALIENIQREDLNAMEVAINYRRLMDECSLTQEELGDRLGKNRVTVTNYLRLLKLPPEIQNAIKQKELSMGHARAIINIEDPTTQLAIYKEVVEKGLSVRKTEELAREAQNRKPTTPTAPKNASLPLAYQKIQDKLSSALSTKVRMKPRKGGSGEIVISYFSDDELERILETLS